LISGNTICKGRSSQPQGENRMRIRLALLLASTGILIGCGGPQAPRTATEASPQARPVVLKSCDDGGDGGVMIEGVCL
jgi:hypothetical protein